MLSARAVLRVEYEKLLDDPSRMTKSKTAGALSGLTPKKYQSGEKDITGGIMRTGDEMVRTALCEAATVLLGRITRFSKLHRAVGRNRSNVTLSDHAAYSRRAASYHQRCCIG